MRGSRHTAVFSDRPKATDGLGQAVGVEQVVLRCPCVLRDLTAREATIAREREVIFTHVAEIFGRNKDDISPYMTLHINGRPYGIADIVQPDYSIPRVLVRIVEGVPVDG